MAGDLTLKGFIIAGLVLVGIGADRLLNAYLLGGEVVNVGPRQVFGVLCIVAGAAPSA